MSTTTRTRPARERPVTARRPVPDAAPEARRDVRPPRRGRSNGQWLGERPGPLTGH